jgi:hypothetical protein
MAILNWQSISVWVKNRATTFRPRAFFKILAPFIHSLVETLL